MRERLASVFAASTPAGLFSGPARATAATRTDLEQVFLEAGNLLGGKRRTFVLGMTGLATRSAGVGGIVGRWGFDDVGGRWLGRG